MTYRVTAVLLMIAPTSAWGQLFVRRPLELADRSESVMVDWPNCSSQLDAYRCGEVEALLPAGMAYVARVTALPLKYGQQTLWWEPRVWCASAPNPATAHTCRSNPDGRTLWQIGGRVMSDQTMMPGLYRGAAILTIESAEETWSVHIPVSLELAAVQPSCTLTGGGHLDFGRVEGLRAGSITLDPVQAARRYAGHAIIGAQSLSYAFANMTMRSGADNVTVTVRAPKQLTAAGESVSFTSLLAYRNSNGGPWTLLMSGSGSRTVANASSKALQFRLGGMVTTDPLSPESRYSGAVEVSFHCGPGI